MAGHSKWANIKHKKAKEDAKRGKVFTRLIRELTVAARSGGSDINTNPRLRLAVSKAQAENMPKDTMERAIKRGAGELDGVQMEEVRFEGYGPSGVAIIVDCLTDNNNRTVGEVRHAFSKLGGNLGTSGSVAFQFKELGVLFYQQIDDENALIEAAIEAGANDVVIEDHSAEVLTDVESYASVYEQLVKAGFTPDESEITLRAENLVPVNNEDAEKVLKLIDHLENLDDTQSVVSNMNLPADFG